MGAGASIEGDKFSADQVKGLIGNKFDQATFDAAATDGFVTKEQLEKANQQERELVTMRRQIEEARTWHLDSLRVRARVLEVKKEVCMQGGVCIQLFQLYPRVSDALYCVNTQYSAAE